MRHFEFPQSVMDEIQRDRFNHIDPLVQRRMEVLLLKAHGQPHAMIAKIANMSRATVQRILDLYETGGLSAVRTFHWKTPVSALMPHRLLLEAEFTARPPHTAGEACDRIEKLTGVRRGPTQVREFLRDTMGLRWRKVAAVPVPPKLTLQEHTARQADFLKYEAPAASGRGPGGTASGVLRGCSPFRAVHFPGVDVVQSEAVCQSRVGASTP
jgi:transposase